MAHVEPRLRNPTNAPSRRKNVPRAVRASLKKLESPKGVTAVPYLTALADELEAAPPGTPITQIVPVGVLSALMPEDVAPAPSTRTREQFIELVREYSMPPEAVREIVRASFNRLLSEQLADPEADKMTTIKLLAEIAKDPEVALRNAAPPPALDFETVRKLALEHSASAKTALIEGKVDEA